VLNLALLQITTAPTLITARGLEPCFSPPRAKRSLHAMQVTALIGAVTMAIVAMLAVTKLRGVRAGGA
jgi:hypothetical protein